MGKKKAIPGTAFVLFPGSGGSKVERVQLDSPPTIKQLYELIGCDCVEHVSVLLEGKPCHMWVDENGRLKEETKRDFNGRATALYHNATLARDLQPRINTLEVLLRQDTDFPLFIHGQVPPIVGKAVVWPYPAPSWQSEGGRAKWLDLRQAPH